MSFRVLATETLTLVDDGRSDFQIVVGEEAIPSERYAAEQLAQLLKEISGTQLPIVTDDTPLPNRAILVGQHCWLESLGVQIDTLSLGDEGT